MNNQFVALYKDTIKKEMRNKSFIFAFIFSSCCIFVAYSVMKLIFTQLGQNLGIAQGQGSMFVSAMFTFLNYWAALISIFFGVNAVRSDFQSNIIYQYLSFPISRSLYLITRLIGTWSMVFGLYIYSYLLTMILFYSLNQGITPTIGQFGSIFVMGIYILFYITLSSIVSFYLKNLGAFLTVSFISLLLNFSNNYFFNLPFNEYLKDLSLLKLVGIFIHICFPHAQAINMMATSFLFKTPLNLNLFVEIPHFLLTYGVLLFLSINLIKKRDL